MMQKKGLGKGLDILFSSNADVLTESIKNVDVHLIDTNAEQPRKDFNVDKLRELAASIERHGMVQPIVVRKNGNRFTIIAGERRFRAAHIAGMSVVPVIIKELDESESMEVALIENIQREDLNPVEEALAIRFLMQRHDLTQQEIAERLAKSRPAIANSLRLLTLPESVLDMLRENKLQAGHARALAALNDTQTQIQLANEVVEKGLSVREVELRVKLANEPATDARKEKNTIKKSPEILAATQRFREKLNTKVVISGTEDSGKIVIEYYSKDDLQNIYDLISRD